MIRDDKLYLAPYCLYTNACRMQRHSQPSENLGCILKKYEVKVRQIHQLIISQSENCIRSSNPLNEVVCKLRPYMEQVLPC